MLKLGWQLVACPDKLWVRVMQAKYGCDVQAMPKVIPHNNTSHIWPTIS